MIKALLTVRRAEHVEVHERLSGKEIHLHIISVPTSRSCAILRSEHGSKGPRPTVTKSEAEITLIAPRRTWCSKIKLSNQSSRRPGSDCYCCTQHRGAIATVLSKPCRPFHRQIVGAHLLFVFLVVSRARRRHQFGRGRSCVLQVPWAADRIPKYS